MLRRTAHSLLRSRAALRASLGDSVSFAQCGTCQQRSQWMPESDSHTGPSCSSAGSVAVRWYAAVPDPLNEPDEERVISNPRIHELVEEICTMNLLEIADLTELLRKRLNIQAPEPGAYMPGMGMGGGGGAAPAAAAVEAPKEAEKTEFDVKLAGFEPAAKIKVIKEVRAMTSLGLKEAKELVEKAPTVVKAGLKKEEAEELKKKLEAAGAKVELE